MNRVTQGGDINFDVSNVRGLGDNYAFRFYTTDTSSYIVKTDGDADENGIIRIEWEDLSTLHTGVLCYFADNLESDEEYSDGTFNRTFGGTTKWYVVTSNGSGSGGGSSEDISELNDRLDAEIERSTEKDVEHDNLLDGYHDIISETVSTTNRLEVFIENVYTKQEVEDLITEAELGGDIPSDIVIDANYVHTDNNYTTAEKTKLAGLSNYDDTALSDRVTANATAIADTYTKQEVDDMLDEFDVELPDNIVTDANYTHTDNNYTTTEKNKLAGLSNYDDTELDERVTTLENAEFVTASDIAGIVVGAGDITIIEGPDYIDLVIIPSAIEVSPSQIALNGESAESKQATLTVSGTNLKADITVSVPNGFYIGATGTATTTVLTASNGTVTNQQVVIRHNGQNESTDITGENITLTSGTLTKNVPLSYTHYARPTITPTSTSDISFKTGAGSEQSATLSVSGINLTAAISASLSGTNTDKFEIVSGATIEQSNGVASGNVVVKYKPSANDSGTHTATLTLSSTNAVDVAIQLSGAVSTLSTSVNSLTFSTDQGGTTSGTFTVSGSNLREDVTVSTSSTYYSIQSPATATPTNGTLTNAEFTVIYHPTASGDHSGTVTVSSSGASVQVTLTGSAVAAIALDSNGRFVKDGIYYGAVADTDNGGWKNEVKVYNSKYSSSADTSAAKYTGVLNIPSTVTALNNGVSTPFSVTKIDDYAFRGNADITSITIPDSVTGSFPANMLYGCTGLKYFNTGNGVTALGYYFASGCTALEEVVTGDSLTNLNASNSFQSLGNLSKVTIGSNVSVIGGLFNYGHATHVTTIICKGTSVIPVVNDSTSFTIENAANINVFIPDGQAIREAYIARVDPKGGGNVISGITDGKLWKYFADNSRLFSINDYPSNI